MLDVVTFDNHNLQMTSYRSMISDDINGDDQTFIAIIDSKEYISEDIT